MGKNTYFDKYLIDEIKYLIDTKKYDQANIKIQKYKLKYPYDQQIFVHEQKYY